MKRAFETAECEAVRRSIFWELRYEKHDGMQQCQFAAGCVPRASTIRLAGSLLQSVLYQVLNKQVPVQVPSTTRLLYSS